MTAREWISEQEADGYKIFVDQYNEIWLIKDEDPPRDYKRVENLVGAELFADIRDELTT